MQTKIIERYFFFILLSITFLFSFLIFRPFWTVLVLGISFSIVLYPVFEWFKKIKIPDSLASLLTVLFFVVLVGIPLFGIGILIFNQSENAYQMIVNNTDSLTFIDSINTSINKILPGNITFDLYEKISSSISFITSHVANIFSSTVSTILSIVLTLLSIFYFLKDGARWKKALVILSPLADADDEKIMDRLALAVNGIVKGYLLIAVLQGILLGIGLSIFGVPNPALWGLVTVITALLPTVGTALVSVPAILFLFFTGHTFQAIGLACWGIAIVGMVDNLLSPIIVGKRVNLPPFLILFSVLGGIALLGPVGILVGPLTISLLYALISIYRNEYKQENNIQ